MLPAAAPCMMKRIQMEWNGNCNYDNAPRRARAESVPRSHSRAAERGSSAGRARTYMYPPSPRARTHIHVYVRRRACMRFGRGVACRVGHGASRCGASDVSRRRRARGSFICSGGRREGIPHLREPAVQVRACGVAFRDREDRLRHRGRLGPHFLFRQLNVTTTSEVSLVHLYNCTM